MTTREIILEAGIEGGSIVVYGLPNGTEWRFQTQILDQSPLLAGDEQIERGSRTEMSWEQALASIETYAWHTFVPIVVHPKFADRVWAEVAKRSAERGNSERSLQRWRGRCGVPSA